MAIAAKRSRSVHVCGARFIFSAGVGLDASVVKQVDEHPWRKARFGPWYYTQCAIRTFTRDYQDALAAWHEAGVPVWGTIPERVSITAGPMGPLAEDGLESYRKVWRKILAAARS